MLYHNISPIPMLNPNKSPGKSPINHLMKYPLSGNHLATWAVEPTIYLLGYLQIDC